MKILDIGSKAKAFLIEKTMARREKKEKKEKEAKPAFADKKGNRVAMRAKVVITEVEEAPKKRKCEPCQGSGLKHQGAVCPVCQGKGRI